MRKLKIVEHISLDGVIQVSNGPGDGDFPYGERQCSYNNEDVEYSSPHPLQSPADRSLKAFKIWIEEVFVALQSNAGMSTSKAVAEDQSRKSNGKILEEILGDRFRKQRGICHDRRHDVTDDLDCARHLSSPIPRFCHRRGGMSLLRQPSRNAGANERGCSQRVLPVVTG
jgi:hypothetical protein